MWGKDTDIDFGQHSGESSYFKHASDNRDYILFFSPHQKFIKTDHVVDHNDNLNTFQRITSCLYYIRAIELNWKSTKCLLKRKTSFGELKDTLT